MRGCSPSPTAENQEAACEPSLLQDGEAACSSRANSPAFEDWTMEPQISEEPSSRDPIQAQRLTARPTP